MLEKPGRLRVPTNQEADMFPSANSTIYRNADGEVTGWDNHYDDAPEPEDFYGDEY
jgi:hypothetical protein